MIKGFGDRKKAAFTNVLSQCDNAKEREKEQIRTGRRKIKSFKKLRNKHSAVESKINSLEHHGLDRCPDKGKRTFINSQH